MSPLSTPSPALSPTLMSPLDFSLPYKITHWSPGSASDDDDTLHSAFFSELEHMRGSLICASRLEAGLPLNKACDRHQRKLTTSEAECRHLQDDLQTMSEQHAHDVSSLEARIADLTEEAAQATQSSNSLFTELHNLKDSSAKTISSLEEEVAHLRTVAHRTLSLIAEAHFIAESGTVVVEDDDEDLGQLSY
ncbi:hypothetical protein C8J57DRAFT_1522783 [Mycena rebaudengoi]|nr:hypothetical protein C8J57DRAFT_1522783 [Mycena rebaudengoi]